MADIVNSTNFVQFALFFIVVLIILIVFGKLGWISFKGDKVSIGKDSNVYKDRLILMKEYDYSNAFIKSLKQSFISSINADSATHRYDNMFHLMFERIVMWLLVNNINNTKAYVESKTNELLMITGGELQILIEDDEQEEKELAAIDSLLNRQVSILINDLINLREQEEK